MLAEQTNLAGEAEFEGGLFPVGSLEISDAAADFMRDLLGGFFGTQRMLEILIAHVTGAWIETKKADQADNRLTLSTGEGRVLSTHWVAGIPYLCVTDVGEADTCTSIILLDEY